MKKLLSLILVLFPLLAFSQADSTKFSSEVGLYSRNVFRGVNFGEAPSIQGQFEYAACKYFTIGTRAAATTNGLDVGYGNSLNIYAKIGLVKNLSAVVTDYFYFAPSGTVNDYFYEYGKNTGAGHYTESTLKYDDGKFSLSGSYTFFSSKESNNDGIYFESSYKFGDRGFSGTLGYLTDANGQSFYDGGGFTTVALNYAHPKEIMGGKVSSSLIFNPNYKNVMNLPRVGASPVNFVVGVVF